MQYLYSPLLGAVCVKWMQTALGKGEVSVTVCVCARAHARAGVCRVLAGVSDNEMQQGTKSWGPYSLCCSFIFTPVTL